jgi:glyoxylase-like metal-dependent hydrolase (beta-lactamase superfamily II)/rhodanese-related sulfurtransferase
MIFRQLFDSETSTYTYLIADEDSREAVLIDPVRDQLERDTQLIEELGLRLTYTLDTHVHADHVTASGALRNRLGSKSVLSHKAGTGCADVMVAEGDKIPIGSHELVVLETPGHTDGCLSYYEPHSARVFTGDALLIRGSGRTDFQQGDPEKLFRSITNKLFELPDATLVYPGHDYKGRTVSSIGEEKSFNPRLAGKTQREFVEIMNGLQLAAPKHIAEAVPANLACGLPQAAEPRSERGWAPIERTPDDVPEITVSWLSDHRAELRLIDIREPTEFEAELGHLQNAELVPLGDLIQAVSSWDREQPLALICRSGGRSAAAASQLEGLGFKRIASVRGGMLEWHAAGHPVVGGATTTRALWAQG